MHVLPAECYHKSMPMSDTFSETFQASKKPPNFLYTVAVLSALLLAGLYFGMHLLPPRPWYIILCLILAIFVALSFTFSVPFYLLCRNYCPAHTYPRIIYSKGLKWGAFFSLGLTFYLGMRAFQVDTLLNLVLFGILYLFLLLYLRRRR